jgi:[NiFe] hydrogenase assembly HybE family chaperone
MSEQSLSAAGTPAARLEAFFERVWRTEMQGLPVVNPALRVEAVGFTPWEAGWLGVMIAPWFFNLLWWPNDGGGTLGEAGGRVRRQLPVAELEFIVSQEDGLGGFLSCYLTAPATLDDHASARSLAAAVMEVMLEPAEETPPDVVEAASPTTQRPLSRRDLLFGKLGNRDD